MYIYDPPPQHLHELHRHFQKYSLLYCLFFCKNFPHTDSGIGDVVASTALMTILKELFHHFHSQGFDSIWMHSLRLTNLYFISLASSVGKDTFSYSGSKAQFLISSHIQMESNQDSAALAQQVQALVTTVEELTRQNQEMRL